MGFFSIFSLSLRQINGVDMTDARHDQAVALLTGPDNEITLVIYREKLVVKETETVSSSPSLKLTNQSLPSSSSPVQDQPHKSILSSQSELSPRRTATPNTVAFSGAILQNDTSTRSAVVRTPSPLTTNMAGSKPLTLPNTATPVSIGVGVKHGILLEQQQQSNSLVKPAAYSVVSNMKTTTQTVHVRTTDADFNHHQDSKLSSTHIPEAFSTEVG